MKLIFVLPVSSIFLFPCVNLPTKVSELGRVLVEYMDEKSSGMSWYVVMLKPLFLLYIDTLCHRMRDLWCTQKFVKSEDMMYSDAHK